MARGGHNAKLARNELIKMDYLSGMSLPECAAKHSITMQRVHQILVAMSVTRRGAYPPQRMGGPQVRAGGRNGGRPRKVV